MDSLTQVALGGAVGYALAGKQVGRKAILWGMGLGTLPDLDVFIPFENPVEAFTYHRGFSHSLLVHLAITPLIAWLALKIHPETRLHKKRWLGMIFLCLATHALLDSLTVYGTQLLWPLTDYPFGVANLFIIDPLVTLPLLFGLIWALWPKRGPDAARWGNTLGLTLSCLYMVWSLGAKLWVDQRVYQALEMRGIDPVSYVSTPAPFTTLLWRSVAVSGPEYHEIYASLFDSPEQITVYSYANYPELLSEIDTDWGIQRLQWFTKGLYAVRAKDEDVIFSDLRMGVECSYAFNFKVARQTPAGIQVGTFEEYPQPRSLGDAKYVFARILDPSIELAPTEEERLSC